MRSARQRLLAFTLVELLVVIALIGLLASFSTPGASVNNFGTCLDQAPLGLP